MNNKTLRIATIGIMAAFAYISFTFLQIKIPTPGGFTSFHLGNTFCVLAALLMGGLPGGIAGAIGMGIGDLLDPVYVTYAPRTIFLKLGIGILSGYIAHRVLHITEKQTTTSIFMSAFIASSAGLVFNIIFDPLLGYFYNHFILGISMEASTILASWSSLTTVVNAIISIICVSVIYTTIQPRMKTSKLLQRLAPNKH